VKLGRLLKLGATSVALLALACKNPVDAALEEALDFSGIYELPNGLTVEFDGQTGVITKLGSSEWGPRGVFKVGDQYMTGMAETDIPGVYLGYVRVPKVFSIGFDGTTYWAPLELGQAKFTSAGMSLSAGAIGHTDFSRKGPLPSTPGTPANPGTPPSGTSSVLLTRTGLSGDRDSQTFFTVTVPSGTKRLVVKLEEEEYGRNLGDLFVRHGSRPTVSRTPTYSWQATCRSIEPNREPETCDIQNPPAGEWHVMVFGYHAYYGSKLTVTTYR
jgi:hypothetical protein